MMTISIFIAIFCIGLFLGEIADMRKKTATESRAYYTICYVAAVFYAALASISLSNIINLLHNQ